MVFVLKQFKWSHNAGVVPEEMIALHSYKVQNTFLALNTLLVFLLINSEDLQILSVLLW